MAAGKEESDIFMSVRLDDSRRICKVSVSSQTTGQDVIELLKPDDDGIYSLVEVWKGCERPVAHEEKLKNVLLQWGSDVDDVVFLLKRKHSPSRQNHKQAKPSRNSPVPEQLQEKQQKVENLEKEIQQKEKHLKSSRNKEATKHSLKTKYVKLLEYRVIEQEERLLSLQSVQDELFKTRLDNEKLVLELDRLRSMFVLKHQQLAEVTAKVELLSRELARSRQQSDVSKSSPSTIERNTQHPQYKSEQTDMYKNQLLNQQHLTETQLWQLQADKEYPKGPPNHNGDVGKDILFLKHGILHERNELNGLLSWQNDEENDTETSADSGHVSNDSPSYQNRMDPSFQFFPAPPEMYCGKVERFDIDQDFGGQLKAAQGGVDHPDGWSPLQKYQSLSKGGTMNPSMRPPGKPDATQQLFVNTNVKQGGVGSVLRQQVNRDSPVSISSLSSMSSESSRNDSQSSSIPGTRATKTDPQSNPTSFGNVTANNNTRSMKPRRDSGSRSSTPTNEAHSDGLPKSNRSSGSKTNTPTSEYKPFIQNESSSDGSSANRTVGSISHYHRNREGSFDKSSSPALGSFKHERSPSLASDSSSEASTIRARTPTIEKPSVPSSLSTPKVSEARSSHLSPTVTVTDTASNFKPNNQTKSDQQTTKTPSVVDKSGGSVSQNGRPSMSLDLTAQNAKNSAPQQTINRKKSPLSTGRSIQGLNDTKGRSSPASFDSQGSTARSKGVEPKSPISDRGFEPKSRSSPASFDSQGSTARSKGVEPKSPISDRGFEPKSRSSPASFDSQSPSTTLPSKVVEPKSPTSARRFDPKGRTSPRVNDPRVDTSASNKSEKGSSGQAPLSSPGVQELLNDMTALKVTTREVKPIQIQTRAEKDSDSIPVKKTAVKTNASVTASKLTSDNQGKRVHIKPPKPLPRKRTKTPPARNSGSDKDLVVLPSSQETKPSGNKGGESGPSKKSQSETKNSHLLSNELATKACDSILRSSRNKAGKKSGKRVSLDPHAVLLHASLEGELELVKSVIHQVEDPSYPNNEGLTALHHAVCNSHNGIVKFLIEYGCDINAADMQGWTSLHCAAANNSIEMCQFLISHGACVFAVTAIEGKTPSRCCEKESQNFEQCFDYLSDIENNFGVSNEGVVYAVYAYQATRKDELSFECGECLTVVRRGDVNEKEWWWARDSRNQFGYIPRNLLGLHPPVAPDV